MADSRLKDITLHAPETSHLYIGQKVTLAMDDRLGWLAVFFGYILPLIIVLTVLLATLAVTSSDTIAAVLSLGALLPYYILLAVFRKKNLPAFQFPYDIGITWGYSRKIIGLYIDLCYSFNHNRQ